MAHDPLFEERIANALRVHGAKAEPKRMFGGVAFMVNGNMAVGITNKGDFMARFDPERHEEILKWPGAKPMTFGHKGVKGFLFVDAAAVKSGAAMDRWLELSLAYVRALPKKTAAKKKVTTTAKKNKGAAINKGAGKKVRRRR
jgi:TfoX/Sxy family transcriptional regulator of competence genes